MASQIPFFSKKLSLMSSKMETLEKSAAAKAWARERTKNQSKDLSDNNQSLLQGESPIDDSAHDQPDTSIPEEDDNIQLDNASLITLLTRLAKANQKLARRIDQLEHNATLSSTPINTPQCGNPKSTHSFSETNLPHQAGTSSAISKGEKGSHNESRSENNVTTTECPTPTTPSSKMSTRTDTPIRRGDDPTTVAKDRIIPNSDAIEQNQTISSSLPHSLAQDNAEAQQEGTSGKGPQPRCKPGSGKKTNTGFRIGKFEILCTALTVGALVGMLLEKNP